MVRLTIIGLATGLLFAASGRTLGGDHPAPGEERSDNGLSLRLVWCPASTFEMGSPKTEPGREENESPVKVELFQGFWLGKYEVTQGEWQQLMGTRPWQYDPRVKERGGIPGNLCQRSRCDGVLRQADGYRTGCWSAARS